MSTPSFLGEISLGAMSLGICKIQPSQHLIVNVLKECRRTNSYRESVKIALQGILVDALRAAAVVAA
jgi:hypothetical protein